MTHSTPLMLDQLKRATQHFQTAFGRAPQIAAIAPGRVNLIGEHTDYNDGFVMPMAIERQTLVLAARTTSSPAGIVPRLRFISSSQSATADFIADGRLKPGEPKWANYVKGVVAGFVRRGATIPSFDAVIDSTVPLGGGLSSSASLEVAVATLLESLTGVTLNPRDKALLCQKAEHEFAGVPCGNMDQSIAVMGRAGHAMMMDCRSMETRQVPLNDPKLSVLIANSNVKHELTGGEYAQRRAQCELAAKTLGKQSLRDVSMDELNASQSRMDATAFRRARHVIGEIARTVRAADAATANDWRAFGELMGQSHDSLRDDFEVSCAELDCLVELARELGPQRGVWGARMTGGGFGGCIVALVRSDAVDAVSAHLTTGYHRKAGLDATLFATRPADGARLLPIH